MHSQSFVIPIEPMGAPRQTRADAWRRRPVVLRYHAFATQLRIACRGAMAAPTYSGWTCYYSMSESWSKKKKKAMAGQLHTLKPDRDNTDKAIMDSLIAEDQCVAVGFLVKRWDDGKGARIELVLGDADFANWVATEFAHFNQANP